MDYVIQSNTSGLFYCFDQKQGKHWRKLSTALHLCKYESEQEAHEEISFFTGFEGDVLKLFKVVSYSDNYYANELAKLAPMHLYAPTIKVFNNGNEGGTDTNHISLNAESAQEIIVWLAGNFLPSKDLQVTIDRLKTADAIQA